MLTRFHKILLAVLAAQLVLVLVMLTRGNDSAAQKPHLLLPGFDAAKVTRLQVFSAGDAKPIDLAKHGNDWVVASAFDFPVDGAKVTDALSPLAKLSAAAPIATQTSRHKQLHVADADFERKLVITSDGKDTTLYVGGSAGARRTALRIGADERVFAVTGVSAAGFGNTARAWVAPLYVNVPRDQIAKLTVQRDGKTVEIARSAPAAPPATGSAAGSGSAAAAGSAAPPSSEAEHWIVSIDGAPAVPAAGESIDQTAIERLFGQASAIDFTAPADPKRDAQKPTATITIERKPSDKPAPPIVIDVVADGAAYWVHDRSLARAALVDKQQLDSLVTVERDKLIGKPGAAPPAGAMPPSPHGAGGMPGMPDGMMMPPGAPDPSAAAPSGW